MKSINQLRREFFELKREKHELLGRLKELGMQIMMKNFELQAAVYLPPGSKADVGDLPISFEEWRERQRQRTLQSKPHRDSVSREPDTEIDE